MSATDGEDDFLQAIRDALNISVERIDVETRRRIRQTRIGVLHQFAKKASSHGKDEDMD